MCIHMIGFVLGIIFAYEYRRILPIRRFRYGLDQAGGPR
jgi:hypothetical protein